MKLREERKTKTKSTGHKQFRDGTHKKKGKIRFDQPNILFVFLVFLIPLFIYRNVTLVLINRQSLMKNSFFTF